MPQNDDQLCYSVLEFCRAAGISKPTLYQLWREGSGPPKVKLGRRTVIPKAQALAWLERKAAAA